MQSNASHSKIEKSVEEKSPTLNLHHNPHNRTRNNRSQRCTQQKF